MLDIIKTPIAHGSIWIDEIGKTLNDISNTIDITTYQQNSKEYKGQSRRTMHDKRHSSNNGWIKNVPHLYDVHFLDGIKVEFQINNEFTKTKADELCELYAKLIGKLPYCLINREFFKTVWIHDGDYNWGGGNNNIQIHHGRYNEYLRKDIVLETLIHEGCHTSLDPMYKKSDTWKQAQNKDNYFITDYGQLHPVREDLAETFLVYFALRCKPNRLNNFMINLISKKLQHRIKFFDSLNLDMRPYNYILPYINNYNLYKGYIIMNENERISRLELNNINEAFEYCEEDLNCGGFTTNNMLIYDFYTKNHAPNIVSNTGTPWVSYLKPRTIKPTTTARPTTTSRQTTTARPTTTSRQTTTARPTTTSRQTTAAPTTYETSNTKLIVRIIVRVLALTIIVLFILHQNGIITL